MDRNYYKNDLKAKTTYNFYPGDKHSVNITQKYYNKDTTEKDEPVEIIQDTLYWLPSDNPPKSDGDDYYFTTDTCNELQYDPFNKDFGPLNLSMTHRFWWELTKILYERKDKECKVYHLSSTRGDKMANSACLMALFMVIILQRTPDEAWGIFKEYKSQFTPFRDASSGDWTYQMTILDCLKGVEKAMELEWYDFKNFDVQEYEYYAKLDNGDLNWIIPGKLCALMGPYESNYDQDGLKWHTPEDYSKVFESLGVERIIRLNEKWYDKNRFEQFGFKHNDLFFVDGSTPSMEIVDAFIELVDNTKGAVAVHWKAGLGRTGTLIGCYAMKRYGISASSFIGWIRIARPGCVLGPQQHFLISIEDEMKYGNRIGSRFRKLDPYGKSSDSPYRKEIGMSPYERITGMYGEENQGKHLLTAKKMRGSSKYR